MDRKLRDPLTVQRETLDNGLRILRQSPPPGAHSVSISFLAPAGWGFDPRNESGAAAFTAALLPSGAGRLDRRALARALDQLGATLSADVDPESAEVTVWGPASVERSLLGILADVVRRPRFGAEDVRRVRRQIFERQLREESQPDSRAEKELLQSLYPAPRHPYHSPEGLGNRLSIGRQDARTLHRFHEQHYPVRGGIVVATTPRRLPDVARDVRDKFGRSLSTAPPAPNLPKAPTAMGSSTRRLPMPGRSQVEIRIGTRSVARSDPQYAAAFLANEVLGGRGLLSRLFQNVREREGLAYHASSSLESMRWGGFFVAQAGTNPKQAKRALRLLRHEVERLSTELVPSGELNRIRESAIGALPLSVETTAGAHELALDVAYHDLAPDHYRRWPAVLRGLSRRELRDASAQAFDISRAITVLAGPL